MKGKIYVSILIIFMTLHARAQQAGVHYLKVPLSGTNVLRDIKDPFSAQLFNLEAPEPDGNAQQQELNDAKRKSAQLFPNKATGLTGFKGTSAALPVIAVSFLADSVAGIPPDNYNAVNKQDGGISVLNSSIAILNTATGEMTNRTSLYNFSFAVGLNNSLSNQNNYRYDPKVVYDPEADRFICVMLNGINQYNHIVVGFSQSNDPDGAWNWYKFLGDYRGDTTWFDYPTVALTHNDFFVCGNKLGYNTTFQEGFRRSVIYQIRKADGYAGNALTTKLWDSVYYGGAPIRNLYPVNGGSGLKGPEQYFLNIRNVAIQNDTVFLIKVPDTAGSTNTALTVTPLVSNLNYGVPPNGRQPGAPKRLATNDGRVLGAITEGNEIQFVSASVVPASGASGIYHGIISNYSSSPVVSASLITVDTLDFGYPNLSYAGQNTGKNTSIITFNYTGPHTYPGFGGVFWDGQSYSPLLKIKDGLDYIKAGVPDSTERWGDYTGSQPAWDKQGSVWAIGIFGQQNHGYGTWMARLRSPFATSVIDNTGSSVSSTIYPNPSLRFIRIRFEMKDDAQVSFSIVDV